jgi:hypothetical protein
MKTPDDSERFTFSDGTAADDYPDPGGHFPKNGEYPKYSPSSPRVDKFKGTSVLALFGLSILWIIGAALALLFLWALISGIRYLWTHPLF